MTTKRKTTQERLDELQKEMDAPGGPLRLGKRYIELAIKHYGVKAEIRFRVQSLPQLIDALEHPTGR